MIKAIFLFFILTSTAYSQTITIQSGQTETGLTLNGQTLYVNSGGTNQDMIQNMGTSYIDGTDTNAQIYGGVQYVRAGGVSTNSIVNGGLQKVYGSITGSTLNGGEQQIYKIANNITVNGGAFSAGPSAVINNFTGNGGSIFWYGSATVTGTVTLNNATAEILGSQSLDTVILNNGSLKILPDWNFGALTIGNLSGTGIINLNSAVADNVSDILNVSNGSGTFGITLTDYSLEQVFSNDIVLLNSAPAGIDLYLVGGAVDVGAYRYDIAKVGSKWELQKTAIPTDTSVIAKNTFGALTSLFYTHLQGINVRQEEARFLKTSGPWVKGLYRRVKLDYSDSHSDLNISGAQVGVDFRPNDYVFAGIYTGYSYADQDFDRSGHAKGHTNSVGVYGALTFGNYYVDGEAVYYYHHQNITSYLPDNSSVISKYNVNAGSFSLQTGYRFSYENWFFEPQIQAFYMRIEDISYRTDKNSLVQAHNTDSLMGRAGFKAGKKLESLPIEPFIKFSVVREFKSESHIRFAGTNFKEDLSETMYEISGGINSMVNDKLGLFLNIGTYLGDKTTIPLDISFGAQYLW